jgi:hypothetical protein
MKNVNAMKINGHEIFYTPELASISIGTSTSTSTSTSISISNDSGLNMGIMPKPGQTKISRIWFIWLENSCSGVEVTFDNC